MDASDFLHAMTVAWYYQPGLPDPSTLTSESRGEIAILRDRHGKTLAVVNLATDQAIIDRGQLRQFDQAVTRAIDTPDH